MTTWILALGLAIVCVNAAPAAEEDLPVLGIVGGANAHIHHFPYQISLQYNGGHMCGGSIISETVIITAAHCTFRTNPNYFSIRAGATKHNKGGQVVKVKEVIIHPNYVHGVYDNDICILKLESPLKFNENVKPIKLPTEDLHFNEMAYVTGWGALSEGKAGSLILQYANAKIFDLDTCKSLFSPGRITDQMFCAGFMQAGRDACQGDSGGPLQYKNTLIGVVSWGIGCAREKLPGLYTYVYRLVPWIKTQVNLP